MELRENAEPGRGNLLSIALMMICFHDYPWDVFWPIR